MSVVTFTVPGKPQPWRRARTRDGRHFVDADTLAYCNAIAFAFRAAHTGPPHEGPVRVRVSAYFPIPKSWPKWKREIKVQPHTARPDADNLLKAVGDALNGVAWRDDSQVASATVSKLYYDAPALHVTVTFEDEVRRAS